MTRNRCKSCRFKKCIREGMSIDGIKMGRIPKLEKLKALNKSDECGLAQHDNEEELEDDCFILDNNNNSMTGFNSNYARKNSEVDSQNALELYKAISRSKQEEDDLRKKEFDIWLNFQMDFGYFFIIMGKN